MFTRHSASTAAMGILLFGMTVVLSPAAHSAIIILDVITPTESVPGLTGFQTDGDDMDGMLVTLITTGGGSETAAWADTGVNAGAATPLSGLWTVSVDGDTFTSLIWNVTLDDLAGELLSMTLDGPPGLTVFDKTNPSTGTAGSAQGRDFGTNLAEDAFIVATYSRQVEIGNAGPVGDLWNQLTVSFAALNNGRGVSTDFSFSQDTDNDERAMQVPEPTTIGLLGLGLLAFGLRRPRRG